MLTIAFYYLKQTFRSRTVLAFAIFMPLLFTAVLGVAMKGLGPDEAPPRWVLLLADEDRSLWSEALIAQLENEPHLQLQRVSADEVSARVAAGEAAAGLLIPPGFSAALEADQPASLHFYYYIPQALDAQVLSQTVQTALTSLEGALGARAMAAQVLETLGLPAATWPSDQVIADWETERRLEVRSESLTRLAETRIPIGAAHASPGMLVMFVLFMTLGGGSSLLQEREQGTLRRLLVMPLSKWALLGGKLLGIYCSALLQMVIMVLFGRYVLHVNWGQDPIALVLLLLTYAFASAALGMMLAALVRTAAQLSNLSTLVVLALAALGGAWWPIEIVPLWMKNLAQFLPTYWGMQGFEDLIVRGLGLPQILPEAAALMAFGLLFLGVGVWRFRFE